MADGSEGAGDFDGGYPVIDDPLGAVPSAGVAPVPEAEGMNAGVGGRSADDSAGRPGAALVDAGVSGVGRRPLPNGGTRPSPPSRAGDPGSTRGGSAATGGTSGGARGAARGGATGATVGDGGNDAAALAAGVAVRGAVGDAGGDVGSCAGDDASTETANEGVAKRAEEGRLGGGAEWPLAWDLGPVDAISIGKSSAHRTLAPTGIRPPQIVQRARRLAPVTFEGSTRYTDWHSGHVTFMTRQSR